VDNETWRRLETVFFEALERPPEEREGFLGLVCAEDAEFRREVAALLKAHEQAGDTAVADGLLPSFGRPERIGSWAGSRLGVYDVEALIGHGGMGEVYRASRADEQYRQQVAIKVLRAGRSSPEAVRRFRVERQILATLQHPNVATLLDGGVTPAGEPYLVMQYVDGLPILRHATERGLTIEQRLRLFMAVANAVQFAHGHLIVHRDLKPSNILVTADGQPLLLDFGIAKLLQSGSSGLATGDLLLLTPQYAAPEQFLGLPVTTATDVYALGVLLYELLSGARPFQSLGPAELGRAVCETDPAPPSAMAPPEVSRTIRGDLDHVVLMAIRREPGRRYASAGQFAEDIARHLAGQPVIARPDDLGYRVGKFVRRNRVAVAAAALVATILVGAVIVTSRESARRAEALRAAIAERAAATRIADFLMGVFAANDPSEARGRTVTARELLDRAVAGVRSGLGEDPGVRMDLELAMGRAYQSLGLAHQAAPLIDEVVKHRSTQRPRDPLKLADAIEWQARNVYARGRLRDGVALLREALALREQALGANDLSVGRTLVLLSGYQAFVDVRDTSGDGERSARRALEIFRAAVPPAHRDIALALRGIGIAQLDRDLNAQALVTFRDAVREARQAWGEDDPSMFNHYEDLGLAFMANGQPDSAIAIHRRLLAARERIYGPDHPDYAFSLYNLARTLTRAGRFEEGLPLFQRAVEVREKALGRNHYLVGFALHSFAVATAQSGDLPASAARFEQAATILSAALGPEHLMAQDALEGLAIVRTMMGQRRAALDALEAAARAGYRRPERLAQEPFVRLAREPRFQALLARMKKPGS
jgi:serine/threonine-protein kinase